VGAGLLGSAPGAGPGHISGHSPALLLLTQLSSAGGDTHGSSGVRVASAQGSCGQAGVGQQALGAARENLRAALLVHVAQPTVAAGCQLLNPEEQVCTVPYYCTVP